MIGEHGDFRRRIAIRESGRDHGEVGVNLKDTNEQSFYRLGKDKAGGVRFQTV